MNTIDNLYLLTTIENGKENIIFSEMDGKMIPFVTSSLEILDRMYAMAQKIAIKSQQEVRVLKFAREGVLIVGDPEGEGFR